MTQVWTLSESSHQDALRGLLPEDLLHFGWLEAVALSPQGGHVAYTVKRPDAVRNSYQTHLYLLELDGRQKRRLTCGIGQASSPVWSRDGQCLAFVWSGSEGSRIEVHAVDNRLPRKYAVGDAVPSSLNWAPDGQHLAFSRWTLVTSANNPGSHPGIPAPEMRVVRRLRYKQNGAGWVENRHRHIHVLDLDSGDIEQITDGECDYVDPCWSWDGQRIAITAFAREQNTVLGQGQILVLDWRTGEINALIPDWRGAAISPQWRADDGAIAFAGYLGEPPVNRRRFYHVWLYELESGRATDLTAEQDQTVGNYAVSDQRPGLTNVTVSWPSGKGSIYFLLTEHGATHVCSVSQSAEFTRVVGGHNVTFAYSPAAGGTVAYGQASATNIGDLYLLSDGKHERLTDLNPWLRSRQLSAPREYWYQGLDGKSVHAWEIRPLAFEEGKKYPTIVYVHCSMFSWDFSHEFQCLANAGYVVAYFNQRGTTAGYGQEHAFGNYYGKHLKEFDEIMLGVDDLAQRPHVALDRMGVTGGSCGGFMTNWIVGHTNRFAAAVTQRSVVNLVSKFGTSDNGPEQATSEGAEPPWVDVDTLWRSSPLAYADQVRTPLLILHSEEDHRCPLSQAEELFAALRWLGRDVELVVFEGEHHGLSRSGRPGNRIERQRRIMAWFDRYLGQLP